ncbi:hypothetical protein [Rhodanobacter geophilus]|uniref:Uncharacterized protein n=1 Tax=Rhodanobacter geophilus TaxID=3162488 RepID=A0ABV3QLT5_9GAMM
MAELGAYDGEYDAGLAQSRALADDAAKRTWTGSVFEAKLAVQRVLDRGANRAVADACHRMLEADARKAGYGWVAQRLATMRDGRAESGAGKE